MKNYRGVILWTYIVEIVLALVVYALILVLIGRENTVSTVYDHWVAISALGGVLLGVAIAALLYYYQTVDSDFGKYLSWRKVDGVLRRIFQLQNVLPFLTLCIPFIATFAKSKAIAHFIALLFIYTCINGLTIIFNIGWVVRLKHKFVVGYDLIMNEKTDKLT